MQSLRALQLKLWNSSTKHERHCTATIGAVIILSSRRFYLAPAHICYPQELIPAETGTQVASGSDDSECDFEGFGDMDEEPLGSDEADLTSRYSLSPGSSNQDADWGLSQDDSTSEARSESLTPAMKNESEGIEGTYATRLDPTSHLHELSPLLHSTNSEIDFCPLLKSEKMDYCLIEFDETDDSLQNLPLFAPENIGRLESGSTEVMAATGSGNIIMGTLSSRRFSIQLPKSTAYTDALFVKFEGFLRESDSGSLVRDAKTGIIYGHIVAGDTQSQNAIIIPAVDIFRDIAENSRLSFTSWPSRVQGISQISISRPSTFGVKTHHRIGSNPFASYSEFCNARYFSPSVIPLDSSVSNISQRMGAVHSGDSGYASSYNFPQGENLSHKGVQSAGPAHQSNQPVSSTALAPSSRVFYCKCEGCRYSGTFTRESSLERHIRKMHITPRAHPCPMAGCDRIFNRADNLQQHVYRFHCIDQKSSEEYRLGGV